MTEDDKTTVAPAVPVGTVIAFAGDGVPEGWLLCDGSQRSKKTFAALFKVIGKTYGETPENFNLPDLQGRVGIGAGRGPGLSDRPLGGRGGAEAVTLTIAQMPSHSHSIVAHREGSGFNGVDEGGGAESVRTNPEGGGQSHDNMQPFLTLRYLIKH